MSPGLDPERLKKLFASFTPHEDDEIIESAKADSTELANSEVKDKYKANALGRKDSEKHTLHVLFKYAIRGIFICAAILIVVRGWHYIMPGCWRWLDDLSLRDLDDLLKSASFGALGALLASYGKAITKD